MIQLISNGTTGHLRLFPTTQVSIPLPVFTSTITSTIKSVTRFLMPNHERIKIISQVACLLQIRYRGSFYRKKIPSEMVAGREATCRAILQVQPPPVVYLSFPFETLGGSTLMPWSSLLACRKRLIWRLLFMMTWCGSLLSAGCLLL